MEYTPQKAIADIDEVLNSNYDDALEHQLTTQDRELMEILKSALEKQIPKKLISFKRTAHDFQTEFCEHSRRYCEHIKTYDHEYKYTSYKCPCCEHLISDGTPSYCWNCGQAFFFPEIEIE